MFFAGDLGQRIFQQPFSWKSLDVDIRGRSKTLRVNYRTSHQIRQQADRLLGPVVTDVDGNAEDRRDTVSVFNGPVPEIGVQADEKVEAAAVARWLTACVKDGVLAHEIGVFVRSDAQIPRARAAVKAAGLAGKVLDESWVPRPMCAAPRGWGRGGDTPDVFQSHSLRKLPIRCHPRRANRVRRQHKVPMPLLPVAAITVCAHGHAV